MTRLAFSNALGRRALACGLCIACALHLGSADAKKKSSPRAAAPAASGTQPAAAPEPRAYASRDDVARFAQAVAERHGLDEAAVRAALAAARYQPSVARLIMPPPAGTAKNWAAYRARFVEPRRIAAGVEFWRAHARWLERAQAEYGVPPEIVVGIIGVETLYGQQMGSFRVVDALATLAFDFPPGRRDRSEFFRDELEQVFVLCRDALAKRVEPTPDRAASSSAGAAAPASVPPAGERCHPLELKGSYAGAWGMPQFMPSSVNRYAVDFDGDGRIDLRGSAADAIGSVARYLAAFGWQRGMPTHFAVAAPVDATARATLLVPDILPSFSVQRFTELGAVLDPAGAAHDGLLALVELQNGEAAPSYVAGTANFYAVTRYNWSSYYALAVIELGEAVRRQVQAAATR